MARIDCTGAEVGTTVELDAVSAADGGTFESSTLQARSGARSWRSRYVGAGAAASAYGDIDFASLTTVAVRWSFYADRISAGEIDKKIAAFVSGASEVQLIAHIDQSVSPARFGLSIQLFTAGVGTNLRTIVNKTVSPLREDEWIDFCWRATIDTGANAVDTFTFRYGRTILVINDLNYLNSGIDGFRFGALELSGIHDHDWFIDDLIIDNTAADIDDARWLHFFEPNSTPGGSSDQWANVGGAASKQAAVTDENDATLVRSTGSVGQTQAFGTPNLGGTAPPTRTVSINVYGSERHGAAGDTVGHQFGLRLEGVADQLLAATNATVTPTTRRSAIVSGAQGRDFTTKPGGGAWDLPDLNLLALMMRKAAGQATDQVSVPEAWGYAEIALALPLTDTATASEQTAQDVEVALAEERSASEAIEMTNTLPELVSETIASDALEIEAQIELADAVEASELESTETFSSRKPIFLIFDD